MKHEEGAEGARGVMAGKACGGGHGRVPFLSCGTARSDGRGQCAPSTLTGVLRGGRGGGATRGGGFGVFLGKSWKRFLGLFTARNGRGCGLLRWLFRVTAGAAVSRGWGDDP